LLPGNESRFARHGTAQQTVVLAKSTKLKHGTKLGRPLCYYMILWVWGARHTRVIRLDTAGGTRHGRGGATHPPLAFTQYCHHKWFMVYAYKGGVGWGGIYSAIVVQ